MIKIRLELPICPWAHQDMRVSIYRNVTLKITPKTAVYLHHLLTPYFIATEQPGYRYMLNQAGIAYMLICGFPILSCLHNLYVTLMGCNCWSSACSRYNPFQILSMTKAQAIVTAFSSSKLLLAILRTHQSLSTKSKSKALIVSCMP